VVNISNLTLKKFLTFPDKKANFQTKKQISRQKEIFCHFRSPNLGQLMPTNFFGIKNGNFFCKKSLFSHPKNWEQHFLKAINLRIYLHLKGEK
jgi:hypothetical protein